MSIPSVSAEAATVADLKKTRRVRYFPQAPKGSIPPHSPEAEQGVLGCLLLDPALLKNDAIKRVPLDAFYDLRNAEVFKAMRELQKKGGVVEVITLQQHMKDADKKTFAQIGGIAFLAGLPDCVPSAVNWTYYLDILKEKHALRKTIELCRVTESRIYDYEGEVEDLMMGIRSDMETITGLGITGDNRRALKIWKASELSEFVPPDHLELVGDNEIFMGYEGVVVFAGPGSSGKSLAAAALALAGARGDGYWMGRKVHRQFKTLVIQAENGKRRLKNMLGQMTANHPEIDIENHVYFSEPPEGGLPFETADFRAALRDEVARLKPSLVILDPWSHVGCEDSADAIKAKLTEIRSCFPYGDDCPCLMIIAHTKKPRAEDVRRGRGLMYMVSGSINLVNTSRCCYVMLPWTDDIEDKRVYFATPKLNDGANYAPTVWERKFGTFFVHDEKTNPKDFGKTDEEERGAISEDDLRNAFGDAAELSAAALVKKLITVAGAAQSTAWRAISDSEAGYLRKFMMRSGTGKLKLKEGK